MDLVPKEISNFFLSMQAGKPGAPRLEACFADKAIYEEPFTGTNRRHEGRKAIMSAMALGWEMPMEDTVISIDKIDLGSSQIVVDWTCRSPSIPGGQGQGQNNFTIEDGLIVSLITTLR